jgi:twinkle protein
MVERIGEKMIGDSWDELGIEIPRGKSYATTDVKIKGCPECEKLGKNFKDFSISVIPSEGYGKCHKCGTRFIIRKERQNYKAKEQTYQKPSIKNITKLSEESLKYLMDRKISQAAINEVKLCENAQGFIGFPYFENDEIVNIKFRNTALDKKERRFSQSPGGKHVMYNYDNAKKHTKVLITEGEIDVLSWVTAGVPFAVSVDSGAPNPGDNIDKKLECFTNSYDLFEQAEIVYLATDNDENGRLLQEELERRLDTEKIRVISYGQHKDANEFLKWEGADKLKALLTQAKEIKMEGVFSLDDVEDKLWDMYHNGLPKGTTTYFPSIDNVWRWREGEVTLVSGYANEGKSCLFNINLPLTKAVFDDWKFGLFIPENFPAEQFYEDLIHTFVGKTTDKDFPTLRCTPAEYRQAMDFIRTHFYLIYPKKGWTLDNIFLRADYLVKKHGIRGFIIDPYNTVEHMIRPGETYDQYISRFMGDLIKFTTARKLSTILVAHQNKPEKKLPDGNYPEPEPYNTKGGGTFFDKTWNYVTLWRPLRNTQKDNPLVTVTSKKIKMKKLVANTGSCDIDFVWQSNRYTDPLLNNCSPLDSNPYFTFDSSLRIPIPTQATPTANNTNDSGIETIQKDTTEWDDELPFG